MFLATTYFVLTPKYNNQIKTADNSHPDILPFPTIRQSVLLRNFAPGRELSGA
jgi:hypothetical protein